MASGIFTQFISTGHSLKLVWSSVADPNTNTSLVTMSLYYVLGSGASVSIGSRSDAYMTYDGVNVGFTANSISFSGAGERLLGTTTRTINHNPDGTKTVNVSATYPMRATISGTYFASVTVSGSAVLDTIPRASEPSLSPSTQEMGQAITVNTNRASTSFVHTLEYTFGNQSGTIATNVGASHSWALPLSLANAIPNATSGSGTITCKTYNDGVLIGTKTVSFTATVPASVVPTISSITITEAVAGLAAQFLAYVQNKSRLNVVTGAGGAYSSTISQIRATIQAKNYTGANITSDIVTASGTVGVAILVTDSRGRTVSQTVNVTVVAYTNPAINSMDAYRVNGSGVPSDDGTSIAIPMNFTIASVNNKNTKSWSLQYRIVGAGTWSNLASGSVYTYNATYTNLTGLFNANNSYEIRLTITDYFASIERIVTISTAFTLLNVNPSGKGFAIGKVSESDTFEVALPTDFTETPTVNGVPIGGDMTAAEILTAIKTVDGAGSGLDADSLDGLHASTANVVNTVVARDANGYLFAKIFNDAWVQENTAAGSYIYKNVSDGYLRSKSLANVRAEIVVKAAVEAVLTGAIVTHSHAAAQLPNNVVKIFDGTISTTGTSGTLSQAVTNFDFVLVFGRTDDANSENGTSMLIYSKGGLLANVRAYNIGSNISTTANSTIMFSFPTSTQIRLDLVAGSSVEAIRLVYGINLV